MKNIRLLGLAIAVFAGALFVQSCGEEDILPLAKEEKSDTSFEIESVDQIIEAGDYLVENPDYTDASEEADLDAANDGVPDAITELDFDISVTDALVASPTARCKNIWANMNLSQGQKDSLKRVHMAYFTCKKRTVTALKKAYRSYFVKAAAERKKLIDAYKNGRITRTELKRRLDALNKRVKAAIQSDATIKRLKAALKSCHTTYMRAVHSILTPAQWSLFVKCKRFRYARAKGKLGGKTRTP